MRKNTQDQSFQAETEAREHAAAMSQVEKLRWNIILSGDLFFVTTSKNIQPYEKLIGSYFNGLLNS